MKIGKLETEIKIKVIKSKTLNRVLDNAETDVELTRLFTLIASKNIRETTDGLGDNFGKNHMQFDDYRLKYILGVVNTLLNERKKQ